MSSLPWIRKEVRLLLPNFVIAVLLLVVTGIKLSDKSYRPEFLVIVAPMFICPIVALLLCLDSFGRELSAGTFSGLLSLPVSRHRIWWTKVLLLLSCMASLWWGWWKVFSGLRVEASIDPVAPMVWSVALSACAFSGGLLWVNALRQVAAAFWISLLAPLTLILITLRLLDTESPHETTVIGAVLLSYSVIGFLTAYRLFIKAQDGQTASRELSFLKLVPRLSALFGSTSVPAPKTALGVLLRKELHMHQGLLGLAGLMALAHLGIRALQAWGPPIAKNSALEVVVSAFWCIWFIFPIIAGATLFSEERRLGVWENQLCIPVPHGRQWLWKVLFGLGLAWLTGALLPVVIQTNELLTDGRVNWHPLYQPDSVWNRAGGAFTVVAFLAHIASQLPFDPMPLILVSVLAVSLYLLAAYASSLSRSLLQALTMSTAGIFASAFLFAFFSDPETFVGARLFRGLIGPLFAIPIALACLVALTYRNSKQVWVGARLWKRNALVFLIVLSGSATVSAMIYNRVWEGLTPMDVPHGANRLQIPKGASCIVDASYMDLSLTAPDGRCWRAGLVSNDDSLAFLFGDLYRVQSFKTPNEAVPGTNWAQLVVGIHDTVGIQKDGSLWVSEFPQTDRTRPSKKSIVTPPHRLIRYGTESNWKQVVHIRVPLLLKTDGTLWLWDRPRGTKAADFEGLHTYAPRQASEDRDWADLRKVSNASYSGVLLRSVTGQAWRLSFSQSNRRENERKLVEPLVLERAEYWDGMSAIKYEDVQGYGFHGHGLFQVALQTNGSLHISSAWGPPRASGRSTLFPTHIPLTEGDSLGWRDIAGNGEQLISVREDGTLWKWSFHPDGTGTQTPQRIQLGTQSDWVAVFRLHDELVSLAQDGSLWGWQFEGFFRRHSDHVLMGPSRKPRRIGALNVAAP